MFRKIKTLVNFGQAVDETLTQIGILVIRDAILESNSAFSTITGYARKELKNVYFFDLLTPASAKKLLLSRPGKQNKSGFELWLELEMVTKNGEIIPFIFQEKTVRYDGGDSSQCIIVLIPYDRKQQRERNLKLTTEGNRVNSLSFLLSGVGHDLNNIAMTIVNYFESYRHPFETEEEKNASEAIRFGITRIVSLAKQLLAFHKTRNVSLEEIDLSELVSQLQNEIRAIVRNEIALTITLQSPVPMIRANPKIMEQIVFNLISNACDAIIDIGTIKIEVKTVSDPNRSTNQKVQLAVSDNGEGMTEEVKSKIFERFFTTKRNGTGIGLNFVFNAVASVHGQIEVISKPEKGAIFLVTFPIAQSIHQKNRRQKNTEDNLSAARLREIVTRS